MLLPHDLSPVFRRKKEKCVRNRKNAVVWHVKSCGSFKKRIGELGTLASQRASVSSYC
jgi:hypothetical protein